MSEKITCSFCGHRFDPAEHVACRSCPLQSGCLVVCCPVCGFETVNPQRSRLAQLASRWLGLGAPNGGSSASAESRNGVK